MSEPAENRPGRLLGFGEPAPWFKGRTRFNAKFSFDTGAGRYVVLCLFGSSADPLAGAVLDGLRAMRERFDDDHLAFFGVSTDPADEQRPLTADEIPGMRFFFDDDRAISTLYRAVDAEGGYRPVTYVLDAGLRVIAGIHMNGSAEAHLGTLTRLLDKLAPLPAPSLAALQAPVLVLPRIFEPRLCRALIDYFNATGGEDSGFMRDVKGRTVLIVDHGHKRRRDRSIEDPALREACMGRIYDRLAPQIHKAFQFNTTRMERHIIACYDAQTQDHFRPHRDNTTRGTAHRRFAVSLFLNSDYEGGQLRFPEFGPALYSAPAGGAVVFSCSMLHEATPVTRGRRYMFLPFLYDEAARKVREENLPFLGSDQPEQP
jgi:peroxiredoxin